MNTIHPLTHREALGYFLNEKNLLGKGVECGVAFGQFAGRILSTWKGAELHLVDPWISYHDYTENHAHVNFDEWYSAVEKLAADDPRAKIHRMTSKEAAPLFKNGELDFCYIDGNHRYDFVLEDLDLWYPKVKSGGVIGGHDFETNHEGGACCDVDRAVIRWARERNIVFSVLPCTSWFVVKG